MQPTHSKTSTHKEGIIANERKNERTNELSHLKSHKYCIASVLNVFDVQKHTKRKIDFRTGQRVITLRTLDPGK